MSVWKRFSTTRVFSIDLQTVFIYRFLFWVKDLIFIELNIVNCNNLAILKDLNIIDVATLITNEIANIYL